MSAAETMASLPGDAAEQRPHGVGARPPRSLAISLKGVEQEKAAAKVAAPEAQSICEPDRETFIPVTRFALMDRLTAPQSWPGSVCYDARRFFQYLDYWRHQRYACRTLALEQDYEPFSPDTDLLLTRKYTEDDRRAMQHRVIDNMHHLLVQANYRRIAPDDAELILTRESHYGLDLHVDFTAFEEVMIYYRGASTMQRERRVLRKFMRKVEFDVPIYQRIFLLFKLKPFEVRVREVMEQEHVSLKEARKIVAKLRSMLPPEVREDNIYLKLFKNIPRTDLEMVFPNTIVKFRLLDKLKLGATSVGGLGMGVASAAGKLALVFSNPIAAAGAVASLGAVAVRQIMSFLNQKQRYMVIMAQNLYFHSLADNRGVMVTLADRAAEEDVKEEMLLYTVLVKERARHSDLPAIDAAIEQYLETEFGINVDFDLEDALQRLLADGIVTEGSDGYLHTLSPREAAAHLDAKWDLFLDHLPDPRSAEGFEFEGDSTAVGTAIEEARQIYQAEQMEAAVNANTTPEQ
ncbi:MAG TPA: TMEM143 family protein [Hyphomicrobiaceae bacterium]|nr:TMEM143 family protein [Hyphomicrobiaceae bacterium]